jgi:hypothetical protein
MKDKQSHCNCYKNDENNRPAPVNPASSDKPEEESPADRHGRKSKTWCSYMERGYRETREIIDNETVPVLQEK